MKLLNKKQNSELVKKFVALILVFAIGAAANADLAGNLTGDNTLGSGNMALNITNGYDTYLAVAIQGAGSITVSLGPNAPEDSSGQGPILQIWPPPYPQGEIWLMADMDSPYIYTDGIWLIINYYDAVAGDVITAYDIGPSGTELNLLDSITIVPEPMTLMLLGLGGLFLRQRK